MQVRPGINQVGDHNEDADECNILLLEDRILDDRAARGHNATFLQALRSPCTAIRSPWVHHVTGGFSPQTLKYHVLYICPTLAYLLC